MGIKIFTLLTAIVCLMYNITPANAATVYTNYTVGGTDGWFFNITTNTSATNYTAWAAGQAYNLGDFLIFKTNTNQTVIQTYNETTYRSCNFDDGSDDDTFQYDGGNTQFGETLTIAVPLTIEGTQYYFSDADDGIQCQRGLAFEINVKHGLGLPPSLNQSPPPPYVQPPSPEEDVNSPPVNVVVNQPSGVVALFSGGAKLLWALCALMTLVLFFNANVMP